MKTTLSLETQRRLEAHQRKLRRAEVVAWLMVAASVVLAWCCLVNLFNL
jgi:hypothetical protein